VKKTCDASIFRTESWEILSNQRISPKKHGIGLIEGHSGLSSSDTSGAKQLLGLARKDFLTFNKS